MTNGDWKLEKDLPPIIIIGLYFFGKTIEAVACHINHMSYWCLWSAGMI